MALFSRQSKRSLRRRPLSSAENLEVRQLLAADLSLDVVVDNTAPKYEQDVVVAFELHNSGDDEATNVVVDINLPDGVVLQSSDAGYNSDTGEWSVASLTEGNSQTVELIVQLAAPGPLTISAEVGASDQTDGDSTPGNGDTGEDDYAAAELSVTRIDLVAFAQAVADSGAVFFGTEWGAGSLAQKELFEDGQLHLPFVNVSNPDRTRNETADAEGIETVPTWRFGTMEFNQVLTLEEIAQNSGVFIPESDLPFIQPIADQVVEINSPLHLPIDAYDPNGGPLTVTVTVGDTTVADASVLSGNRSLRIRTLNYGDMVFELFEGRAPLPTSRVIELAEAGFYDGITFHRIIDDFVLQAGDPTGTGAGGSTLGDFDDQYHTDLQHVGTGVLSYAKAGDDTNDSQFFITEGASRHLDFNHSVFGQLVEGEAVREAISEVPTDFSGALDPTFEDLYGPITMEQVDVFYDTENSLLRIGDLGITGTTTVTVTVTDEQGNSFDQAFTVEVVDDTTNAAPFLINPEDTKTNADTSTQIQLESFDLEGDAVTYFAQVLTGDAEIELNSETGLLTVNPAAGYTGAVEIITAVARPENINENDQQVFTVDVVPGFAVSPADDLTVSEIGATAEFSVVLLSEPTSDVVLDLINPADDEIGLDFEALTFTPSDWDQPQTVSVTGLDDAAADGSQLVNLLIRATDSSPEPFAGLENGLSVLNIDDETARFTLSMDDTQIIEGGTATVTLERAAAANESVTVQLVSSDNSLLSVPAEVTIPAGKSSVTFAVTALDENIVDDTHQLGIAASAEAHIGSQLSLEIFNDDVAALVVTAESFSVPLLAELPSHAQPQFTVRLETAPLTNVEIELIAPGIDLDANRLTFSPTNWGAPQTVIVTGIELDTIDELNGAEIDIRIDPDVSDPLYIASAESISVNFLPAISVSSNSLTVAEDGMESFNVSLSVAPVDEVVVFVNSSDEEEATVSAESLTFTSDNWDVPQTVTVTGQDDILFDGDQTETLTISVDDAASDTEFSSAADQELAVTVTDIGALTLDVDDDETMQPLTDGIVLLRYLAGFGGDSLIDNAVNESGDRADAQQITDWLNDRRDWLDVDGDGQTQPLTDGILIIRYLAGFRDDGLISGAVSQAGTRTTADAVTDWLDQFVLMSGSSGSSAAAMSSATAASTPYGTSDEDILDTLFSERPGL